MLLVIIITINSINNLSILYYAKNMINIQKKKKNNTILRFPLQKTILYLVSKTDLKYIAKFIN